jgi:alpha-ketoglutarate-dependent taurine dioxygenase
MTNETGKTMSTDSQDAKQRSLKDLGGLRRRTAVSAAGEEMVRARPLLPSGPLPLLVEPAMEGVDLVAWASGHRDWIETRLSEHGGILFRGFPVASAGDLERLVAAVAGPALEYRERSSPRSQVAGNVYTSTDYPADQPIYLHNENSYQRTWPGKIFFYCHVEPGEGGETPIADTRRVYQRIAPAIRQRFVDAGVLYVRNFRPGVGLAWQTVFQTGDREAVEEYCREADLEPLWIGEDALRVRSVRPAVIRHPKTGEPVWFNHGTFFHVSTLEAQVRDALLAQFAEEDLPSNTYYGDGAPIEPEVLAALRDAYRAESVAFPWRRGDVLLLDNMMVAHGRAPYRGPRSILVGMAEPVDRRTLAARPEGA